ncbi:hypothetical protein FKM82_001018 [Ascaphus truei]
MHHLDDTDSYEDLEENVYCFPIPSDTPSVPFRNEDLLHVFQDEKYHKDENFFGGGIDQYSEEEKNESESKEGEHLDNSFSAVENLYVDLLFDTAEEGMQKEQKSFIANIPQSTDLPLDPIHTMKDRSISNMDQVFQQKQVEDKIYGTFPSQVITEKVQTANHESPVMLQHGMPTGQDELILLQEKVKMGIISMDEALLKFQQWQNEKIGLDLLQQEKLRQLRDSIIGDKPEDEKLYDKITIVHQSYAGKKRTISGAFDNSIYQMPPAQLPSSIPSKPAKTDSEMAGKSPKAK